MIKTSLDWKGFLDFLLIAVVLFFAYHALNRLKTWKVLFGISVAVIVLLVANILELTGVRWIYSNLSNVALIGMVVVFQPEIRKMFERMVSLKSSRRMRMTKESPFLIAEATFAMAKIKQGALLVLPGKDPLGQFLSGGFSLDGDLSFPLLMSIFDHHSPGHDGAATIEHNKITRFAVRLPLSESDRISEIFGTRHHAAMGLSELCDALIIAVSEETGTVRIFQNGESELVEEQERLQVRARSHLHAVASLKLGTANRQAGWMVPVVEAAFGLALAFLCWSSIIVSQGEIIQKGITAPVAYTGIPNDMTLVEDKLTEVTLLLGGSKSNIDAIEPNGMSIKVDLSHATKGKQNYQITRENVTLPKGIRLLGAEPAQLSLKLEPLVVKEAKIRPQLVGKLSDGLKLLSAEVHPEKLQLRCPASFGGRSDLSITTAPIELASINGDININSQIAPPPKCRPVKDDWPSVEVAVKLAAKHQ